VQVSQESQEWSPAGYTPPQNSGKATGSLIAGILSFVVCPLVLSIVAIILGTQAQSEIRMSGGRLTGEGMAQAGVILGWVSLAITAVVIVVFVSVGVS
jgi:hypothetical protein